MKKSKYKFFWGGIFSNWYPSTFEVDGVKFNCGEQYMMYQKAILFGDHNMAKEILLEKNPRNQKALGRKIKNFNADQWNAESYELVKRGLREKFLQNPDLLKYLRENKGRNIVEASPEDRIWGIGYANYDALHYISDWGENRLGKILTELSLEL